MVKEKMCKQMHLFATLPPQVWHRLAQPAHSKPVRLPKRKQWRPVWLAAPRFVKNVPLEPCSQVLVWLWLSRGPAETQQHLPRHTSPQQHRSLGRGLHPSPSPQGLCYVYWGEVNKQNNCFKWTLRWHLVHLQCCAIKICILFQDISFPSPQSPSALVHISWPPAPGDHPPAFCLHGFTSFLTLHVDEIKIHIFWCLDSSSQPNVCYPGKCGEKHMDWKSKDSSFQIIVSSLFDLLCDIRYGTLSLGLHFAISNPGA